MFDFTIKYNAWKDKISIYLMKKVSKTNYKRNLT